jgi:8-oxo-dGTP pyrophosphatase MutT (NUDIX family)
MSTGWEYKILFLKRVENPSDPWSGQMAFPGGKREIGDLTLMETVIRETREETNINLQQGCKVLGVLTAVRSTQKPRLKVLPFVAVLGQEPSIELNKWEIEDYFWFSLKELQRDKGEAHASFSLGDTPAVTVNGYVIWGLTYEILMDFERRCSGGLG